MIFVGVLSLFEVLYLIKSYLYIFHSVMSSTVNNMAPFSSAPMSYDSGNI